jgi:transcriptional regulator with XRE-family HTH domain
VAQETPPPLNKGGRKRGVWTFTTPEALIRWRTENNISRAEVARRLGVAFSAVERWENGAAVALPELQRRLAKVIGDGALELELGVEGEKAADAEGEQPSAAGGMPTAGAAAVRATSAIVTEYIRHSTLSPDALVRLTRELRDALR